MVWFQIIVIALLVIFFFSGIRIVRPTHRMLVETFGKYKRTASSGFHWIIPIVQRGIFVNITEQMADAKKQEVITKDRLNTTIDAVVFYRVKNDEKNVKASQYNVENYENQIVTLSRTTLRNIIGKMSYEEANSERSEINTQLLNTLSKEVAAWGLEIVRTEMKEIEPPEDVQDSMNEVIKAENDKTAAIDFATATETRADGEKRASIKKAEGIKEGKIIVADGEAYRIKTVHQSANKYFVKNAQKLKAYDVTQRSLENNTKVVLTEKGISPHLIIGNILGDGNKN